MFRPPQTDISPPRVSPADPCQTIFFFVRFRAESRITYSNKTEMGANPSIRQVRPRGDALWTVRPVDIARAHSSLDRAVFHEHVTDRLQMLQPDLVRQIELAVLVQAFQHHVVGGSPYAAAPVSPGGCVLFMAS